LRTICDIKQTKVNSLDLTYASNLNSIETNSQPVWVVKNGRYEQVRSDEIVVGDLVKVHEDDMFAADLILLASSHDGGFCFIQTSSLDGEKNLKKRTRPKDLDLHIPNDCEPSKLAKLADIVSEQATAELYSYTGKMTFQKTDNVALTANQLLLKGSKLKNTDWIVGFVVFTGGQTKLMMNSQKGRFKQSKMETMMNNLVLYIVLVQIILCMIVSIIGSFWYRSEEKKTFYLTF